MHTNMTLQFSNTNLQKTKEHTDCPVGQNKKSKRLLHVIYKLWNNGKQLKFKGLTNTDVSKCSRMSLDSFSILFILYCSDFNATQCFQFKANKGFWKRHKVHVDLF